MLTRVAKNRVVRLVLCCLVAVLFLPVTSWSQQESSSAPPQASSEQKEAAGKTQTQQAGESSSREESIPQRVETPPIRQIGKASALGPASSPLRWGHIYMGSVDFLQAFDTISSDTPSSLNGTRRSTVIRTDVVYDQLFRRSRLALQYHPRLAIVDGEVLKDFTNQDLGFDTYYLLSRRWTLSIGNFFQYYYAQKSFGELYLSADTVTGTTIQNKFLDGPTEWLSNTASFGLGYRVGPRTQLSISPSYTYVDQRRNSVSNRGHLYGGELALNHALTDRTTIGSFYSMQRIRLTASGGHTSVYQSFAFSWSRMMTPSFILRGSAGVLTVTHGPDSRTWTAGGNIGLIKVFGRSSLAFMYSRSQGFPGYLTDSYNDRVDVTYRFALGRRLEAGIGGGYLRDAGSTRVAGKYVSSEVSYLLHRQIYLFASYAHKAQGGDSAQIFTGTRDLVSFGLRWEPRPPRHR